MITKPSTGAAAIARERAADRRHREEPDAALVGHAADALEERSEERIREHRRDGLREENAEHADPLRVERPRVRIGGVSELARRVEDPRHGRGPQALGVVEGVRDRCRRDARLSGDVVDGHPAHALPLLA
jgi:hypothetical protein